MKRLVTWLGLILTALFALAGVGVGYLFVAFPAAAPPDEGKVVASPELLARGQYLVEHVALCTDCHSERDLGRFSGPVRPETKGRGRREIRPRDGPPRRSVRPQHHPRGYRPLDGRRAQASDRERSRSARHRALPDHALPRALTPLRARPRRDRRVRSHARPGAARRPEAHPRLPLQRAGAHHADFAGALEMLGRGERRRARPLPRDHGQLHRLSHSREKGKPVPGMEFAGGVEFPLPSGGVVRSANLTPDATGLASWTKEVFVARFQAMRKEGAAYPVKPGEFQSAMPWTMYAGMTDEDLAAIYDFLRTQTPVKNEVEKFSR